MHFYTLCKVEPGEDTTNIRTANIKGTFFTKKNDIFQKSYTKSQFTFCQRIKKRHKQTGTHRRALIILKISDIMAKARFISITL